MINPRQKQRGQPIITKLTVGLSRNPVRLFISSNVFLFCGDVFNDTSTSDFCWSSSSSNLTDSTADAKSAGSTVFFSAPDFALEISK
jgi:hypothetical protein